MASCGLAAISFAACQSTEQESAKLARAGGAQAAGPAALELGARNRSVRVSQVTLVGEPGRVAVAARLTNTSTRAQTNVPLLVRVTGRGGKTLYTNGTGGIEASLQRIALLRGGQSAWWVDDQVLTSLGASAARLRRQPRWSRLALHERAADRAAGRRRDAQREPGQPLLDRAEQGPVSYTHLTLPTIYSV